MKRPTWHRIKGTHNRGMLVEGVVRHVSEHGVLVQLWHRGRPIGFLPQSEVRAALNSGQLPADCRLEQDALITAAVDGYDDRNVRLLLTLKPLYQARVRTEFNSYMKGHIVTGVVSSHTHNAAFVTLDRGGSAYLGVSQLGLPAHLQGKDAEDILHIGDRVKAKVIDKNESKLRLVLSVSRLLHETADAEGDDASSDARSSERSGPEAGRAQPSLPPIPTVSHPCSVLILENDAPTVGLYEYYLSEAGHQVCAALTIDDFVKETKGRTFDCILADVRMEFDRRSTEIVLDTCRGGGDRPKALFLSGQYIAEDIQAIVALREKVVDAMFKPPDWDTLFARLDGLQAPEHLEIESYPIQALADEKKVRRLSPAHDEHILIRDCFHDLADLYAEHGVAILQRKNHSHEFVPLFERNMDDSGLGTLLHAAKYDWYHSPLGDVVFRGQAFFETGLSRERPGRFRPFFETSACDFHSLLSEPLLVHGEPVYGLLVVASGDEQLSEADREHLFGIAQHLSMCLESARALDLVAHQHSRVSTSDLLIHEIGTQVGSLEEINHAVRALNDGDVAQVREVLERIVKAYRALQDTTLFFRDVAKHVAKKPKPLRDIIESVKPSFSNRCEAAKIRADFVDPDEATGMQQYPEATVRQVLLNLLLNAYIQVKQFRREDGVIAVEAFTDKHDPKLPVRVRVRDNASGIHADHLDLIFDPYFTTREEGMGLGLHICQRLAKALGGEVRVEETFMYCGASFLFCLPLGK